LYKSAHLQVEQLREQSVAQAQALEAAEAAATQLENAMFQVWHW
jgi:hypothetical protein